MKPEKTSRGWRIPLGAGALALGALATGTVAISALAIWRLVIKYGKIRESDDPRPFESLEGDDFVSLTTFRESGEAVSTPVWFVLLEGRIYITTDPDSGKMKRIRNNSRVLLTPCYPWGGTRGESVEGIARPLEPGAAPEHATRAFARKYRLGLAVIHLLGWREIGTITLEIMPVEGEKRSRRSPRG